MLLTIFLQFLVIWKYCLFHFQMESVLLSTCTSFASISQNTQWLTFWAEVVRGALVGVNRPVGLIYSRPISLARDYRKKEGSQRELRGQSDERAWELERVQRWEKAGKTSDSSWKIARRSGEGQEEGRRREGKKGGGPLKKKGREISEEREWKTMKMVLQVFIEELMEEETWRRVDQVYEEIAPWRKAVDWPEKPRRYSLKKSARISRPTDQRCW